MGPAILHSYCSASAMICPPPGTILAFSFDVDSLLHEAGILWPQDPSNSAALHALADRTYVGVVNLCGNFVTDCNVELNLSTLHCNVTTPMPELGISTEMCIPVAPNIYHPHYRRGAILTTDQLPWDGVYLQTALMPRVRAPRTPQEYGSAVSICEDDFVSDVASLLEEDSWKIVDTVQCILECPVPSVVPRRLSLIPGPAASSKYDISSRETTPSPKPRPMLGERFSGDDISLLDKRDPVIRSLLPADFQKVEFMPFIKFTIDLSEVEDLHQSHDLYNDLVALDELVNGPRLSNEHHVHKRHAMSSSITNKLFRP